MADLICARTVGNLLACMSSRSMSRSLASGGKPSQKAIKILEESLEVASSNSLDLPAGLRSMAAKLIGGVGKDKDTADKEKEPDQ